MKSLVWKFGIFVALFLFLNCDDSSSISTLNQLMELKVEKSDDTTTQVIISTSVTEQYEYYKVIDTSCVVEYPWSKRVFDSEINDSADSNFTVTVAIPNDSAGSSTGIFFGTWIPEDSILAKGSLPVSACVLDKRNHSICASTTVE